MSSQHYYNMLVDACGQTVRPELKQFKMDYFKSLKGEAVYCPYTGELLTLENSDAEYVKPQTLEAIVRAFVNKLKFDYTKVQYVTNSANLQVIADKDLASRWAKFHWKRAQLRLISDSYAVSYEPSDYALHMRSEFKKQMLSDGWAFKGSPTIKQRGAA